MPWQVTLTSLMMVLVTILITVVATMVLFRQVLITGGVSSMPLLRAARTLIGLCSTILFFPFVETMLETLVDPASSALRLGVTVTLMVIFVIFMLVFSVLYICPGMYLLFYIETSSMQMYSPMTTVHQRSLPGPKLLISAAVL